MSVVIRMQRAGGRNYPFFRVVVADSRRARDGRFLEKLGYYNPLSRPAQVQLDQERMRFWIARGARPSESVGVLLKKYQAANPVPEGMAQATPVAAEAGPATEGATASE
jgi:small subunit ribosomal protein S16